MTPAEMLDVIGQALRRRPGRYGVVFVSHAPRVLGQDGRALYVDEAGQVYGYTKRQLRRVREEIHAAARHDLAGGVDA